MNLQGRDLKLDLNGEDVRLLHAELGVLGLTIPEAERRRATFGPGTREVVIRFQKERRMEPTGVVDKETARAINQAVDNTPPSVVEGRVTSRTQPGIVGLRVAIVDTHVGGETELGTATTDAVGRYHVEYSLLAAARRAKSAPDLQAKVYAGPTLVGASAVRYNATSRETLDVLLPEAVAALASEHETLIDALATNYTGPLRDLKEADDRRDITYLANKTGWDARAVAMAALADQFSQRSAGASGLPAIQPAFFYALFRAGLPANEGALYQADARTVARVWKQAIDDGVIPTALGSELSATVERFQQLSATRALDDDALLGVSSLKEMLAVSLGDNPARQRQFAAIYTRFRSEPAKLWEAARVAFGEEATRRLQLDGQLAYLTINNAPLIRKLHAAAGPTGLTSSAHLAVDGYYRAEQWQRLIGNDPVPSEIPGQDEPEKRVRYAELLAAQVRLSYPTAVVAQMVRTSETPLSNGRRDEVQAFLTAHQETFEIGREPVERYLARRNVEVPAEVTREVKRIQRAYQIAPSDRAMNTLLRRGVDSAYAVVRFDRDEFVRAFKDDFGGEADARMTWDKAQHVHSAVLNLALSYLIAKRAPGVGVHSQAQIVDPTPTGDGGADVIAYPTLEGLFGSMDYCACDHCRSILSPAAYLVDLLQFLDRSPQEWASFLARWRAEHGNAPYPWANQAAFAAFTNDWNARNPGVAVPNTEIMPLEVLSRRRPDLQHLPLTCENTSTPLPYIDLVNETLEYFVANNHTLTNYTGHSTDGTVTAAELLANPQFVTTAAYTALAAAPFPPPLPFHQPLESLRRYLDRFETPLPRVMERLRQDESVERANANEYGWRDILMEELRLSRAEYRLLTDGALIVQYLYGYNLARPQAEVLAILSNVKAFTRRVGISYEDAVKILKTRFVNPASTLIPRLERLGVPFATLKALKDGTITDAQFDALLPAGLDPAQYGGDVKAWVKDNANYGRIMSLITVANPTAPGDLANVDQLQFRYADPDNNTNRLRAFEFIRLVRFIRLWKKLGWTIAQTDKAITALYPANQTPDDPDDGVNRLRLDAGFLVLLPRLGVVKRAMDALRLTPKKHLLPLLASFAPLDRHGDASLYSQMFVSSPLAKQDPAFADDGYGRFLTNNAERLAAHAETLRAAFQLTDDELSQITAALGFDANTPLTLDNISAIFRRGWLARALKLSVRELLLLTTIRTQPLATLTGIDPFAAPDPPAPPILRLIELLDRLRAVAFKPVQALYLVWNEDLSGKSAPDDGEITSFARTLRADLAAIERNFALVDDPNGQIARARMALVYGSDATGLFFGLLDTTLVTEVAYAHGQPTLEAAIVNGAPGRITYDDFRKQLGFTGLLTTGTRDALKLAGPTQTFRDAVDALYVENQKIVGPFFVRYAELLPLHDAYVASNDPIEKKRSDLLANFLPELKRRRKRQQALHAVSAAAGVDVTFASALLDTAAVLHAAGDPTRPALDDLRAFETPGLSARFYFRDTATGNVDRSSDAEADLAYSAAGPTKLPANLVPADPISGDWSGYLEAPENGFYNFRIETDAGATVTLTVDGELRPLGQAGNVWSNNAPIELRARTLYPITLLVDRVRDTLIVRWETTGRGREVIPGRYLYAATLTERVRAAYIRLLKAGALATGLKLTAAELAHFAAHLAYRIGGRGWLNSLPVTGTPDNVTSAALLTALTALLDFAYIKAKFAPDDERLLAVLEDPLAATQTPDGLLFTLTRWDPGALTALLARFTRPMSDLARVEVLRRVVDAQALVTALRVPVAALFAAATNEPDATIVRTLESALRARHDEPEWLNVLKPISDELRGLQRDALVARVLHGLREAPATGHIDTPDKLFEYFLMDVQMEPCMQTSRVRHALSSVQLFIERCLMNLEPRVAPSAIKVKQWEWMKRYRVWEANRKVFLYPENWLEPELRDDQSSFFKEAMSELLQSDITEDTAATALLNYLARLEEVAKLEPCGVHLVANDPGTLDDVVHVVARTAGAHRKYYHRRRDASGWSPWEAIKLDIEDDPVMPVVWNGRLLLFWLKILKQAPLAEDRPGTAGQDLIKLKTDDLDADTRVTVRAVLCWSEYYNGKWQLPKTSDVDRPTTLGRFNADPEAPDAFRRSQVRFWTLPDGDGLRILIMGQGGSSFILYNTHSLPVRVEEAPIDWVPVFNALGNLPHRGLETTGNTLTAYYYNKIKLFGGPDETRLVLNTKMADDRTVGPRNLPVPWDAPFLYEDGRHVFYVTTTQRTVPVPDWSAYGLKVTVDPGKTKIPPIVSRDDRYVVVVSGHRPRRAPIGPHDGATDPSPFKRLVSEDAFILRAIATTDTVRFGNQEIGPSGGTRDRMPQR